MIIQLLHFFFFFEQMHSLSLQGRLEVRNNEITQILWGILHSVWRQESFLTALAIQSATRLDCLEINLIEMAGLAACERVFDILDKSVYFAINLGPWHGNGRNNQG